MAIPSQNLPKSSVLLHSPKKRSYPKNKCSPINKQESECEVSEFLSLTITFHFNNDKYKYNYFTF